LSRRLDPAELSSLVTRFEMRAFEVTASLGGRVVKHIGDEVMFVSLDPVAACRIALTLTEAFTADGIEPRGGLCAGDVLVLHGDYYGPVVNLASRLTDAAVPGEVLVDDAVVAALVDVEDVAYEPAGRRQLKGFDDTVRVHALLRP
jgi:adenylate cyclase